MKKTTMILLMLFICTFLCVPYLFSQAWEVQFTSLNPDQYSWQAIDAADSNVAVVVGNYIYLTTNGGRNWQQKASPENANPIFDISITDAMNFWAVTQYNIYHSSDGGQHWETQYYGIFTTSDFNYIKMFNELEGVAVGDAGENKPLLVLKTTDGGKNWVSQNQSYLINGLCLFDWKFIDFVSPDIGYVRLTQYFNGVYTDTLFLQKTIDGGKTWNSTSFYNESSTTLRFFDENLGLIRVMTPADNSMWQTTDGGQTWSEFKIAINMHDFGWINDIEFIPGHPEKVFASCWQKLYFSSDTGKTWTKVATLADVAMDNFQDIIMIDDKHGWIISRCNIFSTSTGGATSVQMIEQDKNRPNKFSLFQNYPNPFNPTTSIRFVINKPTNVSLKIYNTIGQQIVELINENKCTGNYEVYWDGNNQFGEAVNSGVYLAKLITNNRSDLIKMLLIK